MQILIEHFFVALAIVGVVFYDSLAYADINLAAGTVTIDMDPLYLIAGGLMAALVLFYTLRKVIDTANRS